MRVEAVIDITSRVLRGLLSAMLILIICQAIPSLIPGAYEAATLAGVDAEPTAAALAALIFISVAAGGTPLGHAASIARSILILYLTTSLSTISLTLQGVRIEIDAAPLLMIAAASALVDLARTILNSVEWYAFRGRSLNVPEYI